MSDRSALTLLLPIILAAAALAITGCGSGSTPPPRPASGATATQTPTHATLVRKAAHRASARTTPAKTHIHHASQAGRGKPATTKPATKTPSAQAVVVGALTVGRASVSQVVLLHDLAVGATHMKGAPPGVGAPQAAQLARTLNGEARRLADAQAADVATLASALSGYASLAKQLAARRATDSARLPTAFVATLRSLDTDWRPAMTAIGQADHTNLLAGMAPLLFPPTT
jgi:hypothetical protein